MKSGLQLSMSLPKRGVGQEGMTKKEWVIGRNLIDRVVVGFGADARVGCQCP